MNDVLIFDEESNIADVVESNIWIWLKCRLLSSGAVTDPAIAGES
jgi:hypothetical protein